LNCFVISNIMAKRDHIGEVYTIPITENIRGYARVFRKYVFDVYNLCSEVPINVDEVVNSSIAFTVYVHVDVFKKSNWSSLGIVPLSEIEQQRNIIFFKQDIKDFDLCTLVDIAGNEYKSTPQECVGKERLAVWDHEHVEERLRNIYLKKKDLVVENMKVKIPSAS